MGSVGSYAAAAATSLTVSTSHAAFGQIFTPEQWRALSHFLGNAKVPDNRLNGKFVTTSWIIDTGEIHHVTGNKSLLFDAHDF